MAESEEERKNFLMKVKDQGENVGLNLNNKFNIHLWLKLSRKQE